MSALGGEQERVAIDELKAWVDEKFARQ